LLLEEALIRSEKSAIRAMDTNGSDQIGDSENPRVGSSILSLATNKTRT
jgi:hypothetical protein